MSIVIKSENRRMRFDEERLERYMGRILHDFPHLRQEQWMAGVQAKVSKEEIQAEDITRALYTSAVELISKEEPDWTYVAARSYLTKLYKEAAHNRGYKS